LFNESLLIQFEELLPCLRRQVIPELEKKINSQPKAISYLFFAIKLSGTFP